MLGASAYEIVLAVHIMAVVIAFGFTFAYPLMFLIAARADPSTLPTMHRIEYTVERTLVNGGLLVVIAAGIFLASDGHLWSQFFVQWGLGAAIVIGALVGSVMIPTAKRAETAIRTLSAGEGDAAVLGPEYGRLVRRSQIVGGGLSLLVLATIAIMVIKP